MENGQFWTKTMDYPLWKDLDFSTFSTSCYYSLLIGSFIVLVLTYASPNRYFTETKKSLGAPDRCGQV